MKGNHNFKLCQGVNFAKDIENKTFLNMNSIQTYFSATVQNNPCMYKTDHKTTAVPEKRTDSSVEILCITYFFKYFIIKVVFSKKKMRKVEFAIRVPSEL